MCKVLTKSEIKVVKIVDYLTQYPRMVATLHDVTT